MTNRYQEMLDEGIRNHTLPSQAVRRLRELSDAVEEQKREDMATAQEKIHILQKRIDDIETAEKFAYKESAKRIKEIKELKQQIIEFEKDWILPIIRGNNNGN